jgi:hypothetical protein
MTRPESVLKKITNSQSNGLVKPGQALAGKASFSTQEKAVKLPNR